MQNLHLPIHPTKRHPLTGEPIQAIWVTPRGKVCWPIMGGAPDPEPTPTPPAPTPPAPTPPAPAPPGGRVEATDAQGNPLGFPKDTPTAEMSDKEQASYWRNISRKHEGRVKDLTGDRTPEQVKADLEAYAELQKAQQTPAEQALNAARDEGKNAGIASERRASATAIFRGSLEAGGITGDDLEELVASFSVDAFIGDSGIDTTKITNFAKRFAPAGKANPKDPDFGGGRRREPQGGGFGSAGKAEAERRRAKHQTTSGA